MYHETKPNQHHAFLPRFKITTTPFATFCTVLNNEEFVHVTKQTRIITITHLVLMWLVIIAKRKKDGRAEEGGNGEKKLG